MTRSYFTLIKQLIGYSVVLSLALIAAMTFMACSFSGAPVMGDGLQPEEVNAIWDSSSVARPYQDFRNVVYEDRGRVRVEHGASCVRAKRALVKDNTGKELVGVRLEERASIPSSYDGATVFLNGWRLKYRDKDHHVVGLGSAIFDIVQDERELRWKAGGVISDKNGDDRYLWCYFYTLLFWNSHPFDLDAVPVDSDDGAELTFVFPYGYDGERTALRRLFASIDDEVDVPHALLPRGFGSMWTSRDDHHLSQFALKFGDTETVEYESGQGGFIQWYFETILKDYGESRRDYTASQLVSTLNGESVKVIQPEFAIRPLSRKCDFGVIDPLLDVVSETVVVDDVPFDYAVPMLTGWDIGTVCEDHHIRDIGAWIEGFTYEKADGASSGRLTYTIKSIFVDTLDIIHTKGQSTPRYQVSILGLNSRGIVLPGPTQPPVLAR